MDSEFQKHNKKDIWRYEKDYDRLEWSLIKQCLIDLCFCDNRINWMMELITTQQLVKKLVILLQLQINRGCYYSN